MNKRKLPSFALSLILPIMVFVLLATAVSTPTVTADVTGAVLTNLTVNTVADVLDSGDGLCSLREAITAANTDTVSGGVAGECPAGSGADTITLSTGIYTFNDGTGETRTATAYVTVNGVNDAPVATDDAFLTDEDTVVYGDLFADNGNGADFDVDSGFAVTAINGTLVTNGELVILSSGALLTINHDGGFSYDPDGQFEPLAYGASGADSFTYTIDDGAGETSTATADVTVNGVNDAPVATDDAFLTDEDTVVYGDLFADNGQGYDYDIDSGLAVTAINGALVTNGELVILPSGALLTIYADGTFGYDPNSTFEVLADGASAYDSFEYTIDDGAGGVSTANVGVSIDGISDAPIATNDAYTTTEDSPIMITAAGVISNDSDAENDPLTVTLNSDVNHGSLVLASDGRFVYTPTLNYNGEDTFTYILSDGILTNTATVSLTVTAVNDAPIAVADNYTTTEDVPLVIADSSLADYDSYWRFDNDLTDASGNGYTGSANGGAGFSSDTPSALTGQSLLLDGSDDWVGPINDVDFAQGDYAVSAWIKTNVTAIQSIFAGFDSASMNHGLLIEVGSNGTLRYLHRVPSVSDTNLNSPASVADGLWHYIVATKEGNTMRLYIDGNQVGTANNSDSITFPLDVTFGRLSPIQSDRYFDGQIDDLRLYSRALTSEEVGSLWVDSNPGVLFNDSDVDGDPLTAALQTPPAHGAVDFNPDGSFIFTPTQNFNGEDSFVYILSDGVLTDTTAVSLTVTAVNDAPIAVDDGYSLGADTMLAVSASGLLSNDIDIDSSLTAVLDTPPLTGTLVLTADGSFDYTPPIGYSGAVTFTYHVNDGLADSNVATVTLTVIQVTFDVVNVNGTATLSWGISPAVACAYDVYRSALPYSGFTAEALGEVSAPYLDSGALGDPLVNRFYYIEVVDCPGIMVAPLRSRTIGAFGFALTPGE